MIPIKYVGKREQYTEGAYGSKVEFLRGETKHIPDDLAAKLLRHPDVYQLGEEEKAVEVEIKLPQVDEVDELQYSRDAVANMDREGLELFVKTHFRQDIDKRKKVETLRADAIRLIDQYGLPQ